MSLVTTSQAVKELFGIEGSEPLRSKANSYLRNGVIPPSLVVEEGFSDDSMGKRGKKLLKSHGVTCLFNALVLDAFFSDTKFVKGIFENKTTRAASVSLCEEILLEAQAVTAVTHLSEVAQKFLYQLSDTSLSLRESRLVCPFTDQRLPQMDKVMQNTGLLYQMLRSQRLSLSLKEKILLSWLEQDLHAVAQLSDQVDSALLESDLMLSEIIQRVQIEYQEGQSFNSLLNLLPD